MYERTEKILKENDDRNPFELARAIGGWAVYDHFSRAFDPEPQDTGKNVMDKPVLSPPTDDPKVLAREVKRAGQFYGAGAVGITEVDRRWIYTKNRSGEPVEMDADYSHAIVALIPVDPEPTKTSPGFPAARESAISYSRMAFLISCLAEFIRRLGYKAWPAGNDTGISIPLAMDAGLGRLGRNGLLINPELGSCLKICKVFTDMNLAEDQPLDTPLLENCRTCRICSEACEIEAISKSKEPTYETSCPANNPGILRWPVDGYKCYQFWIDNGSDCSTCIAVCPLTLA
ncbi:MAG: hypothetical protein ABEI54_02480, partial [Candidatus Bipolaricaulia bacterium]